MCSISTLVFTTLATTSVADGTDCDDADPAAYPGGLEVCDGSDNDCDGTTDPGTSIGAGTYYADVDRDSYGDPASATGASRSAKSPRALAVA